MELFKEWHGDTLLGVFLLTYVAYCRWSEWRFRRRAVRVSGEVLKAFPHNNFVSYFVAYTHGDTPRVAEYCGPALIGTLKPGDKIDMLIDAHNPPDVPVPDGSHIKWFGAGGGNCSSSEDGLFSPWDFLTLAAAIFLIARGL
jgi:hypothetical protein